MAGRPIKSNETDIRTQLFDVAQELVQTRGYNAISYRDLAERIGIRTASIHYYFPSKADLGQALLARYNEQLKCMLASIDASAPGERQASPRLRLQRFMGIFLGNLKAGNRMCLGGMLAAEHPTLPTQVQNEVKRFFHLGEHWLEGVLAEGRSSGEFRFEGSAAAAARTLLASLEGAMMAARTFHDERRLQTAGKWILKNLLNGR